MGFVKKGRGWGIFLCMFFGFLRMLEQFYHAVSAEITRNDPDFFLNSVGKTHLSVSFFTRMIKPFKLIVMNGAGYGPSLILPAQII